MAAQFTPSWAELNVELVQRVAQVLEEQDRRFVAQVCSGWRAAVHAAPELIPALVLAAPEVPSLSVVADEQGNVVGACQQRYDTALEVLDMAALLAEQCPFARSVRITGGAEQVPFFVPALLLALPPTLLALELCLPCTGPLHAALQRFPNLRRLQITGNGAGVHWAPAARAVAAGSAAPGVLESALQELVLDCRKAGTFDGEFMDRSTVEALPPSTATALAGLAARLHSLELRVAWTPDVRRLCSALPALRALSLHLYRCRHPHASAAVTMLNGLPRLTAVELALHAHWGTDLDEHGFDYPVLDDWQDGNESEEAWVTLPPLAGIRGLTRLALVGDVALPPDWRQLASLIQLQVHNDSDAGVLHNPEGRLPWGGFTWGPAGSLATLSSLTRLDIRGNGPLPDVESVASLPCLAELHVPQPPLQWTERFVQLRPGVAFNVPPAAAG